MKNIIRRLNLFLFAGAAWSACAADAGFYAEVGASYFSLHHARFERSPEPLQVRGGKARTAPFVSAGYSSGNLLGLRVTYHAIGDIESVAQFGSPPGQGQPVTTPVVVWGHYEDEVHLVTVAPEFTLRAGRVKIHFAPEVNWVSSRGLATYSSSDPTVSLVQPQRRSEDGFTLGGALGVEYPVTERAAVSLTYHYTDLDPSFGRQAHVLSGGFKWAF